MTNAHVPHNAYDECGYDLQGKPAYHNGDYIGEIVHVSHLNDFVIIFDSNNTSRPIPEVWNPDDHSEKFEIIGTLNPDGVDHWINNDRRAFKYGIGSCYSTGVVNARGKKEDLQYNDDCAAQYYDCVRWGSYDDMAAGDSGSLAFGANPNGSGYYGININTSRWFNYSFGAAGYAIRQEHDYRWDNL
jgi:hypothetical protein